MTDPAIELTGTTEHKRTVTRCYIDEGAFVLRTIGQPDNRVEVSPMSAYVGNKMINEMIARLLLIGEPMDRIVSGEAIPSRSLPNGKEPKSAAPRALNQVRRAILAARIADLMREEKAAAKEAGYKVKPEALGAITQTGEAWVRGLTDDQAARLVRAEAVQIELAKLRGTKATLDELLADPAPATEPEPDEAMVV
jgi:hypothetical protein